MTKLRMDRCVHHNWLCFDDEREKCAKWYTDYLYRFSNFKGMINFSWISFH